MTRIESDWHCAFVVYPEIPDAPYAGIPASHNSLSLSVDEEHITQSESLVLGLFEPITSNASALIRDCQSLLAAIEEQCFMSCKGNHIHLREILVERAEKSDRNNQYEVLSSTVTGIYSQREYFNKDIASADNTGYKIIHRGDIVLSPQNLWMGNINYNDCFEAGIVSPSYKVFSVNSLFDKDFIACLLKTKRAQWEYSQVSEQGASIVRRNLNIENFLEISFTIPTLEEQRRIGQRISAVSNKIGLEQQFLNQLCSQKRCLLNSMFI